MEADEKPRKYGSITFLGWSDVNCPENRILSETENLHAFQSYYVRSGLSKSTASRPY